MKDYLITIHAHRDGQAAFERNLAHWEMLGYDILILCPEDAPVETKHEVISCAKAEHHGWGSKERMVFWMEKVKRRNYNHFLLAEYDCLFLGDKLPEFGRGFYGILFHNAESPKYMADRYANPPWIIDSTSLNAMHNKAWEFPAVWEMGHQDRYLSAIAQLAGIPILPYDPPGFSRGTVGTEDLGQLCAAIICGTEMIHGIKDEFIYQKAVEFHAKAKSK